MFTWLPLEAHVQPRSRGSLLPVPTGAGEKMGSRENLGKISPNFP